MKKIFSTMLCIVVVMMLFVFPVSVGAEEALPDGAEIAQEAVPVEGGDLVGPLASEQNTSVSDGAVEAVVEDAASHTIFSRAYEFARENRGDMLSIGGTGLLLAASLIAKSFAKKTAKETKETLAAIHGHVGMTLGGQDAVINVTNKLVDGYNKLSERYETMKDSYEKYGATENERNRISGAVLATNIAILEILSAVYVHNRQLPQGAKDLVMLKYANCLKLVEDDESLIAIVEAVRNNIGNSTEVSEDGQTAEPSPESTETTSESAEV